MNQATFEMLQAVWELDEGLQRLSRTMLAAVGVTGPQRLVLRLIEERPEASANEISRIMHLNRSTVSGIVRRLEAEGFLRREQHREDGRVHRLVLTEKGLTVVQLRQGTIEAAVDNLREKVTPGQVETAIEVMRELAGQLKRQRSLHRGEADARANLDAIATP